MTITAKNETHARKIFDDLKAKGYHHTLSYLWMQEWTNKAGDIVIVGKGYDNKKPGICFI